MDINSLAVAETATIELRHPQTNAVLTTDKGDPMTVTIYSQYTKQYKMAAHKFNTAQVKILSNLGKDDTPTEDQEKAIKEAADKLVLDCIVSISIQVDGKVSKDPKKIIGKPEYAFLQQQIDNAIMSPSVFMKAQPAV